MLLRSIVSVCDPVWVHVQSAVKWVRKVFKYISWNVDAVAVVVDGKAFIIVDVAVVNCKLEIFLEPIMWKCLCYVLFLFLLLLTCCLKDVQFVDDDDNYDNDDFSDVATDAV